MARPCPYFPGQGGFEAEQFRSLLSIRPLRPAHDRVAKVSTRVSLLIGFPCASRSGNGRCTGVGVAMDHQHLTLEVLHLLAAQFLQKLLIAARAEPLIEMPEARLAWKTAARHRAILPSRQRQTVTHPAGDLRLALAIFRRWQFAWPPVIVAAGRLRVTKAPAEAETAVFGHRHLAASAAACRPRLLSVAQKRWRRAFSRLQRVVSAVVQPVVIAHPLSPGTKMKGKAALSNSASRSSNSASSQRSCRV